MTEIQHVSEETFQKQVLDSALPVLVDFTATWCGPCKMLEPVVKQLAIDLSGKMEVVKLDIDRNQNMTMQFQVMGVPTLILFKGGKPVERMTGYQPKDRILKKLAPHLG
jgi:thioredoxin 1